MREPGEPGEVLREYERNGESFRIRVADKERDADALAKLARNSMKTLHSFPYVWESWGNWESDPPYVIETSDGVPVGFHAVTFLKMGYVNSYYIVVDEAFQGRKLGSSLVEVVLEEAPRRGCTRYTTRTDRSVGGYGFYKRMGLEPLGKIGDEFCWDFSVEGILTIPQLTEAASERDLRVDPSPPPIRRLKQYKKKFDETFVSNIFDPLREFKPVIDRFISSGEEDA